MDHADDAAVEPTAARTTRRGGKTLLLRGGAVILVLLLAGGVIAYLKRDWLIDRAVLAQSGEHADYSFPNDRETMRVLLCGTGSPQPGPAAQACTMVSAGGRMFVFDVGDGATKSLQDSDVPISSIERVFLTHFHSDHFNGLGTLNDQSWIWGRSGPLEVTGPTGTVEVVESLNAAYRIDNGFRAENMSELASTAAAARANPTEVEFPSGARSVTVYEQDGVRIDAHLVVHDPVRPALGYVVHYLGKKVFVSGDTEVGPLNLPAMQDADLVVHEAYATHLVRRSIPLMREMGMTQHAQVAERTIDYHADTIELARQSEQAGVKHLALTHLTPYPDNFVSRYLFTQGMSDHFGGEITVGQDGMMITV